MGYYGAAEHKLVTIDLANNKTVRQAAVISYFSNQLHSLKREAKGEKKERSRNKNG